MVGFGRGEIALEGEMLTVAVADQPALRRRGLMGVEDLGDLDGMLFVFSDEVETAFTMRGTLIPLDIAFFDRSGRLVDRLDMVPCDAEPCPAYQAAGPFRWALETPAGDLAHLDPTSILEVKSITG